MIVRHHLSIRYITMLQLGQFVIFSVHASLPIVFTKCDFPDFYCWVIIFHGATFFLLFSTFYRETYVKRSMTENVKKAGKNEDGIVKYAETQKERPPLLSGDAMDSWERSFVPGHGQSTELKHSLNVMWGGHHSGEDEESGPYSKIPESDVFYEKLAKEQGRPEDSSYNIYFAWRPMDQVWGFQDKRVRHHEVGVQAMTGGPIFWWNMSLNQDDFSITVNGKSYKKYRSR